MTSRRQCRRRTFGPGPVPPAVHNAAVWRRKHRRSIEVADRVSRTNAVEVAVGLGVERADAEEAVDFLRARGASWGRVEDQLSMMAVSIAFYASGPEWE